MHYLDQKDPHYHRNITVQDGLAIAEIIKDNTTIEELNLTCTYLPFQTSEEEEKESTARRGVFFEHALSHSPSSFLLYRIDTATRARTPTQTTTPRTLAEVP